MHLILNRVSTEGQVKHGYSLESQEADCRKKLAAEGITDNIEVIVDDASGKFIDRPAILKLRELLEAGVVESVTWYDPDRMARDLASSMILADEIEKAGAKLFFVTGDFDASAEGRLFFAMRGAISAYEREKIRERTTRSKRTKAAKGKIVFNAHPFGYDWDKANSIYVINEAQAKIARMMLDMLLNQGKGCRVIARELKEKGIFGPKGKPISPVTVHKVLSRPMYSGTHYIFRQRVRKTGPKKREITNIPPDLWVPISVPAIFTEKEYAQAQAQLQENKKIAKRRCRREYLLRGVLHCALCGRSLVGTTRPMKRKTIAAKEYSYYTCITKESGSYMEQEKCKSMRIPVESFDEEIWSVFTAVARGEKSFSDYMRKRDLPDYSSELARLARLHEDQMKRHAEIAKLIREGLLNADAVANELRLANKEIAATKTAMTSLQVQQERLNKTANKVSSEEILAAVSFEEKRSIVLKSGLKIYATRPSEEHIDFYFE